MNYKIIPVVLAGGLGTRLHSVIADKPKVLASVNGRPFLSYLLDQLIAAGFQDVILCTGYKGEMVKEAFGSHYKGLNIRYSQETEPLGTGGALRYALPMIESKVILIMNGDSYIDVNICTFIEWYLKEGHDAAILLTRVPDMNRYGCVKINEEGKVLRFAEKQKGLGPGWINAGVYLLKTFLLNLIPLDRPFSLEQELFPDLIAKDFYGYFGEGCFLDIGTPISHARAEGFFERLGK